MSAGAESRRRYVWQIAEIVGREYGLSGAEVLSKATTYWPSRARRVVIMHCHGQGWTDEEIACAIGRDRSTVVVVRNRFRESDDGRASLLLSELPPYLWQSELGARNLAARWAGAL